MAENRHTTLGDVHHLRGEIFADHDVIRLGRKALARLFLKRLLKRPDASDAELEEAYRATTASDRVPERNDEFWAFVAEHYLHLEAEPADKFIELTRRVQKDLQALANNLRYIADERAKLLAKNERGKRVTPEERYYERQLEYYERRNIEARNEIVDFVTNNITTYAIQKAAPASSFDRIVSLFLSDMPYAYDAQRRGTRRERVQNFV